MRLGMPRFELVTEVGVEVSSVALKLGDAMRAGQAQGRSSTASS